MKDMAMVRAARPVELLRQNPIEKAKANPASRQMAIAAKCCDCVGGPDNEGWRKEIRLCQMTKCPLHGFRPYRQSVEET